MSTLMNKDLEPVDAFLAQLDSKVGIEEIISRYPHEVEACGKCLLQGVDRWYYAISPGHEYSEFLDFIDGNGFYIQPEYEGDGSMYSIRPLVKGEYNGNFR